MIRSLIHSVRKYSTVLKHSLEMARSYEDAVRALNGLQSNAAALEKVRKERDSMKHLNIPDQIRFSSRVGISLDDIDSLNVIHVSGTKGKGSTCAFCESILKQWGYKVGFFSSPHLIEVRERIRINGRPLPKEDFTQYFWEVYNRLRDTEPDTETQFPSYFRFLTVMAFHVFLKEKVDVAIIEVGIGGEYDSTNIVRRPIVCGISSLGLDHTSILGDTIGKIAWHKAGILKQAVPAFTVPQLENGLDIIAERARQKQCPLNVVPNLTQYGWHDRPIELGLVGIMQQWNASLALQLCKKWREVYDNGPDYEPIPIDYGKIEFLGKDVKTADDFEITENLSLGLKNCWWAGRNQKVERGKVSYYLDGAHTTESVAQCIDWFKSETELEEERIGGKVAKVLLFNITGERTQIKLLEPLAKVDFDVATFSPNIVSYAEEFADHVKVNTTMDFELKRCERNKNAWTDILSELPTPRDSLNNSPPKSHDRNDNYDKSEKTGAYTFSCISDVTTWLTTGKLDPASPMPSQMPVLPNVLATADKIQVLVTGSLHLVGCTLRLIDPHLNDPK